MKRRTLRYGLALIVLAGAIFGTVTFLNSQKRQEALVFSRNVMLSDIWGNTKLSQLEPGTHRTLDQTRDGLTTSEGESYTMLRAVWQDDRATFEQSWQWTKNNLKRPTDHLFSWQFGKRADGSYGILTDQGGQNTASDADSDIALALVMAGNRWHNQAYIDEAKLIMGDLWDQEVVEINGRPVLTADNVERLNTQRVIVNPSYFSPYAYKVFATYDPKHNWKGLSDNSYTILEQLQKSPLDKSNSVGLIPNWIMMDRETGVLSAASGTNLDTNYGYDAMRLPFRLALDYAWFKDARAKTTLGRMSILADQWQKDRKLASVYAHDGSTVTADESPAIYGGGIGYFMVARPDLAPQVYDQKLRDLYSPDAQAWKAQLNYYDDNWAWFGLALYNKSLPNLTGVKLGPLS